ncbi:MAG: extracellular solute-binding protein [Patescibacteria group bacterium]
MSKFQIALTTIFVLCIVVGIALFASSKASDPSLSAHLVVWGPFPADQFDALYQNSSLKSNKLTTVTYVKKDPANFDSDFIEALADGAGPDMVILRDDMQYKYHNKLFPIPYKNFTERTFKDTFIEESEMYLAPEGIVAFPLTVDPLVLYWNRDLFTTNLIPQTPKFWDEVYPLVTKITHRDSSANITQSTLALGEWRNITNAKEILSMLLIQAGSPITSRISGVVTSVLNSQFNHAAMPSQSGVNFYTQFSNPTSPTYTWNRSLPSSQNFFLSGNLAMYIGFASELFSIQQKNANLNFDVTYVPQIRDSAKQSVFAHMYGISIVKQSKQIAAAYVAMNAFIESNALLALEKATNLPPVRRNMLANKPTDAFRTVFYNSALLSHSWIDPDSTASATVFRDMIESITSGQSRTGEALSRADNEIGVLLK